MSLPLVDNPAVVTPHKVLTARQRQLLAAIARYRSRRIRNGYRFGNERSRYSNVMVEALERHGLVVERSTLMSGPQLCLTDAGKLALDRLQERKKS